MLNRLGRFFYELDIHDAPVDRSANRVEGRMRRLGRNMESMARRAAKRAGAALGGGTAEAERAGRRTGDAYGMGMANGIRLSARRARDASGQFIEDAAREHIRRIRAQFRHEMAELRELRARGMSGQAGGIGAKEYQRRAQEVNARNNERALGAIRGLGQDGTLTARGFRGLSDLLKVNTNEVGLLDRAMGLLGGRMGAVAKLGAAGIVVAGIGTAIKGIEALTNRYVTFQGALYTSMAYMEGTVSRTMEGALGDTARDLARRYNMEADSLASAYQYLAQAGLDAQQSLGALPVTARFAKAGMFDLNKATSLLLDSTKALGKDAGSAAQDLQAMTDVADLLTAAAIASNAEIEQLAESLANKGAAAIRLLNKPMEEGVAVLAAYADVGLKGAAAGEALNMILRDLQTAAIKNGDVFKKYGIDVFDQTTGKMRNVADIIGQVEVAFGKLSDAEKRAATKELGFQDRSVGRLLQLLGRSSEIRRFQTQFMQASGATASVAEKQMRSLEQRSGAVAKGFDDLKIRAGKALSPIKGWAISAGEWLLEGLESPIDTITRKLKDMGAAGEYALAYQLRALLAEGEREQKDIRERLSNARINDPNTVFDRGRGERVTDTSERNLLRLMSETRAELNQLMAEEAASDGTGAPLFGAFFGEDRQRKILAYEQRIEQIQELIDLQRQDTAVTQQRAQAQRELNDQTSKANLQAGVERISAEIAAAQAQQGVPEAFRVGGPWDNFGQFSPEGAAGMDPITAYVNAKQQELNGLQQQLNMLNGPDVTSPGVDEEGGMPDPPVDEKDLTTMRNAREELERMAAVQRVIGSFNDQNGNPFRSLNDMPERLREAVQEILSAQEELAGLDKTIAESQQAPSQETSDRRERLVQQVQEYTDAAGRIRASLSPDDFLANDVREARRELGELTGPFQRLADLPYLNISQIPADVRQAVEESARLGGEIGKVQKLMQQATARGQAAPDGSQELLDDLERQRAASQATTAQLVAMGDALRNLPQAEVSAFLQRLNQSASDAFLADEVAGPMREVGTLLNSLGQARLDVQYAKASGSADALRVATKKLEEEQRRVLARVRQIIPALRVMGLSEQEQADLLGIVESALAGVGVEMDDVRGKWDKYAEAARVVSEVGSAIAAAAREMGTLDEKTVEALDSLSQLASTAAGFAEAVASRNPVAIITGSIQLLSSLGRALKSVFASGKSMAEAQAEARSRADLIRALDRLREAVESQSSNTVKRDVDLVERLAKELEGFGSRLDRMGAASIPAQMAKAFADIAVSLGLAGGKQAGESDTEAVARQRQSLATFLQDIDSRYGTNLTQLMEEGKITQLLEQLRLLSPRLAEELADLGSFGNDVAGIIRQVTTAFGLLGKTDAAERTREIVRRLTEAGHSLGEFGDELEELAGLDMSTEAGQRRFDEIVHTIMDNLADGAFLGDLTRDQLIELITGIREGIEGGDDDGSTDGYQVSRSITEVTGNRLASGIMTMVSLEEKQADHLAAIRGILESYGGFMLTPPPPLANMTGSGDFVVRFEEGAIRVDAGTGRVTQVPGRMTVEQGGRKIGTARVDSISAGLRNRHVSLRRAAGNNTAMDD